MENEKIGYLVFDSSEGYYLSINGCNVGWNLRRKNAAILTKEQAYFWQRCLQNAKGRNGFSVLMMAL
jgi:hypothetical protein